MFQDPNGSVRDCENCGKIARCITELDNTKRYMSCRTYRPVLVCVDCLPFYEKRNVEIENLINQLYDLDKSPLR